MIDWRRFIPGYWSQLHPTSWDWDAFVRSAIDRGDISDVTNFTCNVGGIRTWVANWPYGYGHPYDPLRIPEDMMPSVKTRIALRNAVVAAAIRDADK